MGKKILLINKSGLNNSFFKALKDEGFDVISFFDDSFLPYSKSIITKYINIIIRIFLKDKEYIGRCEKAAFHQQLFSRSQFICKNYHFDYALFFRADLYPEKMVSLIRGISKMMISYQYDGMEVCKNILNYTHLFNRIFLFDPADYVQYQSYGFLPLTNCWFHDDKPISGVEHDFFYVGVGTDERREKIQKIQNYISVNYTLTALLTVPLFRPEQSIGGIKYSHSGISYEENMKFTKSSNTIIDFKLTHHNGLSFRFFEAMFYEKKVITDNMSINTYDFYHPNNIFITDFHDFTGLKEFMNLPYQKISENIVKKYSFSNWIKYVFDEGFFESINLPACN